MLRSIIRALVFVLVVHVVLNGIELVVRKISNAGR
jgi:Na+-translocating ferredoxin:NAD+ oxidoreductase RnfA subunit